MRISCTWRNRASPDTSAIQPSRDTPCCRRSSFRRRLPSQAAGGAFIERLAQRTEDLDPASGPDVAAAQIAAFREWEQSTVARFGDLTRIHQPTLVVNGIHDDMIPVANSYRLAENLPNAVLLVYPDSGHGSLCQFHESFTRHAVAFLTSDSQSAPDQVAAWPWRSAAIAHGERRPRRPPPGIGSARDRCGLRSPVRQRCRPDGRRTCSSAQRLLICQANTKV